VVAPPRVKAGANYHNARLAHLQGILDGYDDAILLDDDGKVAELPLSNIFIVKNDALVTPSVTNGILEGITRLSILELARNIGIPVIERAVDRSELYVASEMFSTTTLAPVTPIVSVDRYRVGHGSVGPVTAALQNEFNAVTRRRSRLTEWLTAVYE
jgi:branched-chain amino acid aminotransferase